MAPQRRQSAEVLRLAEVQGHELLACGPRLHVPRAQTPLCFHNRQGQGGDFNFGIGNMGEPPGISRCVFSGALQLRSIYGQRFRDERFCYKSVDSESLQ